MNTHPFTRAATHLVTRGRRQQLRTAATASRPPLERPPAPDRWLRALDLVFVGAALTIFAGAVAVAVWSIARALGV